jgi:hypothetical protein
MWQDDLWSRQTLPNAALRLLRRLVNTQAGASDGIHGNATIAA